MHPTWKGLKLNHLKTYQANAYYFQADCVYLTTAKTGCQAPRSMFVLSSATFKIILPFFMGD